MAGKDPQTFPDVIDRLKAAREIKDGHILYRAMREVGYRMWKKDHDETRSALNEVKKIVNTRMKPFLLRGQDENLSDLVNFVNLLHEEISIILKRNLEFNIDLTDWEQDALEYLFGVMDKLFVRICDTDPSMREKFLEIGEDPNIRGCTKCGKKVLKQDTAMCSGCRKAWYCTKECQAADWKAGHREECKRAQRRRERRHAEKEEKSRAEDEDPSVGLENVD